MTEHTEETVEEMIDDAMNIQLTPDGMDDLIPEGMGELVKKATFQVIDLIPALDAMIENSEEMEGGSNGIKVQGLDLMDVVVRLERLKQSLNRLIETRDIIVKEAKARKRAAQDPSTPEPPADHA